ncbi:hypothetical protein OU678_14285, partial [Escherichia coli]|nr:hypothetical protein [Escherichia coli]
MSMELMVKAMKIRVGNPLRKLVLIKLADNASDQGECWPSYPQGELKVSRISEAISGANGEYSHQ